MMSGYTNDLSSKRAGELVIYKNIPVVIADGSICRGQCRVINYWIRRFWKFGDELGFIVGRTDEKWIPIILQYGCNYGIKPYQRILVAGRTMAYPARNTRRYDRVPVQGIPTSYINIYFSPRWL